MSINKKNEIAVIVSISIILTMIIAVAGSAYSNSVEKDKSYKLIQSSLLIYKNNPSIENLRKISNDLYQFNENNYNNKILISNAIKNINDALSNYCQKDDCASYAERLENYNGNLKELNGVVSAVNRDGVESIGFICPRIATISNNDNIVYECVQSYTATRVALIVDFETYKKHGGFLRDNMYVENIGPILYEMNNYDPYRGNYKTTAMIATYRSIGISGRDIYNANEKIKLINNELEAIKPLYASAEYIAWIKVFNKTVIDISNLEKAIGIKGNNEWVKKYLSSQQARSEYKELYELGVIEDFESKDNKTPSKKDALNNFYGLKENNGKVKIGDNKVSDVWFGKTIKYGHDDIYVVFIRTHNLDESGNIESCHACAPKISVITYKKRGNEWEVLSKQSDFTTFGSYGETGNAKPEVFLLAANTASLLLDASLSGFGATQSGKVIFSFVNDVWQDLGYIGTFEDDFDLCDKELSSSYDPNRKCVKYSGSISVIPQSDTNYPDLLVKRAGKYSDGSEVSNVAYKFDGKSYTIK